MAIEKITAPSAVPASVADWEAVLDIQAALLLAVQGAERIVGGNVVKGAVFLVGGATYLATADTAITGSASDYVKLTVSIDGLTLEPSYVADLTGVAWDSANNGYYDIDGNLYVFDELKALAGAAIAAAALRAIGGKNIGSGWPAALLSSATLQTTQGLNIKDGTAGTYSTSTLAPGDVWLIPAGIYVITVSNTGAGELQIKDNSGNWYGNNGAAGMVLSDGVNFRIINTEEYATITVYRRKLL